MSGQLLAFVGSGAFIALLTAVVNAMLVRRKTNAETDSIQVATMRTVIETLTARLSAQEQQSVHLSERSIALALKLDAAEEKVGILERRERESLLERADLHAYISMLHSTAAAAGLQVPDPPRTLTPRTERTRREDRHEGTMP